MSNEEVTLEPLEATPSTLQVDNPEVRAFLLANSSNIGTNLTVTPDGAVTINFYVGTTSNRVDIFNVACPITKLSITKE